MAVDTGLTPPPAPALFTDRYELTMVAAALAFARAISEYGSLVLLSGNLPYSTEVASVRILSFIEGDQLTAARGPERFHESRW